MNSSSRASSEGNIISHNNTSKNGVGIQVGYLGDGDGLSSCASQTPSIGNMITDNTANENAAMQAPGVGIWLTCNLYGETAGGGSSDLGTIFKLSPNSNGTWTETVVYSFTGGAQGASPAGGLTLDKAGNLYGTTAGLVFEVIPSVSKELVLYTFKKGGKDGSWPRAGVVLDAKGNLYGTTYQGGAYGWGSVFQLTRESGTRWSERLIYSFTDRNLGGLPNGSVIFPTSEPK